MDERWFFLIQQSISVNVQTEDVTMMATFYSPFKCKLLPSACLSLIYLAVITNRIKSCRFCIFFWRVFNKVEQCLSGNYIVHNINVFSIFFRSFWKCVSSYIENSCLEKSFTYIHVHRTNFMTVKII